MTLRQPKFLQVSALKDLSLSELGLWLLIPFASLTSHTLLPLPPTFVLLLAAIACWLIKTITLPNPSQSQNPKSKISQIVFVFALFTAYLFASQYILNAPFRRYMGATLAPLYLILVLLFSEDTTTDFLKKLGQKFIRYSLVILSLEALYRYGYSIWLIAQKLNFYQGFYQFKFFSPMYSDSNLVAVHLVLLLFFILWWGHAQKQPLLKECVIALILIGLTLSRTSIVAVFAGLAYYHFFRNLEWKKTLAVLLLFCGLAFLGVWGLKHLLPDLSFQSKFLILREALEYYKTANLNSILFGIGFSETEYIMTFHAHNYFLLFLMEAGAVGLLFLCITLLYLVKITKGSAMIILLPFFVQTSTESVIFMPYFYVIMALLILFSNNLLMRLPNACEPQK